MACEYIYKGTTYSSKEEFISKVIPTLQNSTLSKFDKVPTNKQVYLSSIKNYEDNIVNFEKAIQAIKDNNYKIILPNNAGRYVASVESKGIRAGTIPIAENPYSKEAKEGKFDKEYALSYLKERIEIEKGSIENENRKIKEIEKVENDIYNKNISSNQFLQLLNKDNNWVTFFIKSIIQDSAKKGYEKVLFPSGNTASKIEGHTTLEEFKKQKEDRIKELENNTIPKWQNTIGNIKPETYFNMNMFNSLSKEDQKDLIKKEEAKLKREIEGFNGEINQLKQEIERVETEGFGALRPIYNFYENTVNNVLKKQYGKDNVKQVTDEYGNTWNEITITPKMSETIRLNTPNGKIEYTGDLAIEEKMAEEAYNSKDERIPTTLIGKFIQSIRNMFRNIFKERDSITRLIRNLNQGRFDLQKSQNKQRVRYSTNQTIKPGVEELNVKTLDYFEERNLIKDFNLEKINTIQELIPELKKINTPYQHLEILESLENVLDFSKIKFRTEVLKDYEAYYIEANKTITYNSTKLNNAYPHFFIETIIHELLHAVSRNSELSTTPVIGIIFKILSNSKIKLKDYYAIKELYNLVLKNTDKTSEDFYGLTNVEEFISEAYSNNNFQEFLKTINISDKNSKNLFEKFYEILLKILSLNIIKKTYFDKNKSSFDILKDIDKKSINSLIELTFDFNNYSNYKNVEVESKVQEGFKEFVIDKNEPTDSDVFHYPFDEVYDELDQSEPTGEFEDTFDSEFETNSKKLDKIILNRYLKIQKSLERQKDKLVSEFNKIENTNDFTKDAEIYFDKHKELISEINIVEEKLKRIKAVVDAIFDKKDITSVVIAESNLIIDDINKLLKSENISPAELDYYYNLTKLLEEIHDENLKQEDSSLFTSASSEDLNQLKKLKNTFSNLNNDLLELLRKNINIKNDPIKDAKLFSQWFLKVGDYTNDILKKAESMISKSLFNITKFLNKELEAIKELHLKADSDFKRTGKTNNKFDIFFDKNKRIVQVFNYEYTDAAAKLYNAFRFASKDSAKSKRLELIRFHKQHSILLNAKYLFPDIYEHLTGTKPSVEEINKNIALYKSYLDDYTFEKMKSKVYKQTIKYLSKRDNDFFMSNMPFDENSLIQEFLTYIPKDKSNYNDKYSKIVQNDNLRNVYDKFMDLFNELKLISQGTTRSNLNKGFLPFLEKTMIENLSDFSFSTELGKFKQSILSSYDQLKNNSGQTVSNQVENPLKTVNDGLRSFLETKANDYYKQEKINLIYFLAHKKLTTNSAKLITEKFGPGFPSKKAEEIIESWTKEYFTSLEDTQTNDIQVLMNLMAQTVTSYKQKQAIESNLNLIKIAFDNQAVGEFDILGNLVGTNPTKKGRETKLAELLEVTINHFFGKNVQKPQLNDFLKRINNVSVAKQEELNKLVKEINENKELTPNEKIELEKALQNKFKQDSKYVDLDKINDKLLQYLRVLFLGWSPKSAFFNAAMGHIGNYMETIDGRIVNSKDLSAGVKMLFGKEKKKIQKLIANLSLIEDITKDFKKTTEESLHNEKWKNFKPERLQQIVEKSNQSPLIAALLNKSFNGVRIIDMIDESGNFLPQYEEYEYKFVNTAKYLIEKVHGPYDSNRIIMAETTSLGKNVIFMKKWMITSFFMKRFGSFDEKPREDLLMDYQFKGTYITLADVFNTMSNDQSGQRNYLLGIMKTMKAIALSDQSLTEVDKANLRSVRADLLIIGALLIAQQLVKYMLSDDDDDNEGLVFLLNTFFRIETELGSHYFLIDTFEGLAKNTIPQLDVYNRLEKIIKSFDENARISPAIRLAQMVPALNSGVSLYNFFNQQILYNR